MKSQLISRPCRWSRRAPEARLASLAALFVLLAVLLPGAAVAQQGYVGLEVRNLEKAESDALGWEEPRGAIVVQALAGGPSASAGVTPGDVIVSVDGREVSNIESFVEAISSKAPGAEVSLRVLRAGRERRVKLVLGVRPANIESAPERRKCAKYAPSLGRSIEVPCPPES